MSAVASLFMLKRNRTWIMETYCFDGDSLLPECETNIFFIEKVWQTKVSSKFNDVKSIILKFRVKNLFYSLL